MRKTFTFLLALLLGWALQAQDTITVTNVGGGFLMAYPNGYNGARITTTQQFTGAAGDVLYFAAYSFLPTCTFTSEYVTDDAVRLVSLTVDGEEVENIDRYSYAEDGYYYDLGMLSFGDGNHTLVATFGPYYDSTVCDELMGLQASNETSSGATLSWIPPASGATTFIVNVYNEDDTTNALYSATVTGNSASVTGLQPSTWYDAYVSYVCANGETQTGMTYIYTQEIGDILTVVCDSAAGLANIEFVDCGENEIYSGYAEYEIVLDSGYILNRLVLDGSSIDLEDIESWMNEGLMHYYGWFEMEDTNHVLAIYSRTASYSTVSISCNTDQAYFWAGGSRVIGSMEAIVYEDNTLDITLGTLSNDVASDAGYSTDYNMLYSLTIDGNEIALDGSDTTIAINNYLEEYGYIIYSFSFSYGANHTVYASFGPFSNPNACDPLEWTSNYLMDDGDVLVEWAEASNGTDTYYVRYGLANEDWEFAGSYLTDTVNGTTDTLSGLTEGNNYRIEVVFPCTNGNESVNMMGIYIPHTYTFTFINEGNGYLEAVNYTQGGYFTVSDTMVMNYSENDNIRIGSATIQPTSGLFGYLCDSSNAQLTALYIDGIDMFNEMNVSDNTDNNGYLFYTYYINADSNHTIRAVFGPYGSACLPATGITVDTINIDMATLHWSPASTGANTTYNVELYRWNNNTDMYDSISTTSVSDTTITITGLVENTEYFVFVRNSCGDNTVWTRKWFTTPAAPHTITFTNNGGDMYYFNENYNQILIDSAFTTTGNINENGDFCMYMMTSDAIPGIADNRCQLNQLFVDGVDILANGNHSTDSYSLFISEAYGTYYYHLCISYDADHTVEAVFGPYINCFSVGNIYVDVQSDHDAWIWWDTPNGSSDGYSVLVGQVDTTTGTLIQSTTTAYNTNNYYIHVDSLMPSTLYGVIVVNHCDTNAISRGRVFMTYGAAHHVTISNNGGYLNTWGYQQTPEENTYMGYEGQMMSMEFKTYLTESAAEYDGINAARGKLRYLYVDGEEMVLDSLISYSDETAIWYYLALDFTTDHSVTALYCPVGGDIYTVSATVNDPTLGDVYNTGMYYSGSTASIYAVPHPGVQFVGWGNGGTTNPLILTVNSNITLTATFVAGGSSVIVHDTVTVTNTIRDTVTVTNTVHDTVTVTVTNTVHDTVTITNTVTDTVTVTNTVHDTVTITNTVTDTVTVTNTVHDTVTNTVYDTIINDIYHTDTIYIYQTDTVYIYDTVYVGVDDVKTIDAKLYSNNGQVVVEGAEGNNVELYDAVGRRLAVKHDDFGIIRFDVPVSGTYIVRIGNHAARRIVVIR